MQPEGAPGTFVGIGQAFMTTPSDRISQIELSSRHPELLFQTVFLQGAYDVAGFVCFGIAENMLSQWLGVLAEIHIHHIHIEPWKHEVFIFGPSSMFTSVSRDYCLEKDLPGHTVDGSEIWRSPVDMVQIPIIYQGFSTIQTVVGLGISEPSTVCSKWNSTSPRWWILLRISPEISPSASGEPKLVQHRRFGP